MSGEMVKAALVFFHRQNTFLYFKDILPNHVFVKPQIPFDIINDLVGFSYKVTAGEYKGFPKKIVDQLKQGIITEKMLSLDKISDHFQEGVYEVKDAIELFCHTFTLAELEPEKNEDPKNKEYLMMCLKAPIPEKLLSDCIPKSSDAAPLVVKFSTGCVPLGCFGSTVSCLISKYGWKVVEKGGSPTCLAHNIVSLRDPDLDIPVDTVLVDFTQHLEIHISTPISELPTPAEICTQICGNVFGAIQEVFEWMRLDTEKIKVVPAIGCDCTEVCHFATFTKNNMLICSESSIFKPDMKQSMWIGVSESDNYKPNLTKLVDLEIPRRVGANYTKFGILLLNDSKGDRVETIEKDCHYKSEAIVLRILCEWLREQPTPATRKNLVDILIKCDLKSIAKDVQTKFTKETD